MAMSVLYLRVPRKMRNSIVFLLVRLSSFFLYTKMRNVGGIAQTEAQKSSDLFMKCRYLDEITGGRGIVFATGTPISNSMVELYTIQRYLQMSVLEEQGLQHFDAWAANYGETVTAIELSPEGYTLIGR